MKRPTIRYPIGLTYELSLTDDYLKEAEIVEFV